MKKDELATEIVLKPERTHFLYMLAKNPNYFGNIPDSALKPIFQLKEDTSFEQLTCVGYNPDTTNMEATFSIKGPSGHDGGLCTPGSQEYIRFYLDFHDGAGFIDQGIVAVNVHDIPAQKDCHGSSIFPLSYVATLKKSTSKLGFCDQPLLPTLRAVLSWNSAPPAASPNWLPVWGNRLDSDVQIKPGRLRSPFHETATLQLTEYLAVAAGSPDLTTNQLTAITGINAASFIPEPSPVSLAELAKKYVPLKVPASRFAFSAVKNLVENPTSEFALKDKLALTSLKIDVDSIIDKFGVVHLPDASKADVDYEELECVGLDYNTESLVATIHIKKNLGYSGSLCDPGSTEYIAFWVDWNNKCEWQYINTVSLKVHDIKMAGSALSYSVSLPLDAKYYRKLCSQPNVVRVRGVLSWETAPSTTNPNKLNVYGNRVDAHVQIKPGMVLNPGQGIPLFTIIGGIDVDHVDNSGYTVPGSIFAFNGMPVPDHAPFGGEIVINGPSFPGYFYRFKVINLRDGSFTYLNNSFPVVGWSLTAPFSPWITQAPGATPNYYPFLTDQQNILNVLARFVPGTDDAFLIEMDLLGVPGIFWKVIQMDNTWPTATLDVDDGGDCTHYAKGDPIKGNYFAFDKNIWHWNFGSTWGGDANGMANTIALPGVPFDIPTAGNANPCGSISLEVWDKTIVDSQSVGHYMPASYIICLH
jgi:hypothetical protein